MTWRWFRGVSVVVCLYMAISRLGETGSYLAALNMAALFLMIWLLGYNSRARGQT
jgi:hypothetical protein